MCEYEILNAEAVAASGGSAVVVASRGAKDVMRKLLIHKQLVISNKHRRRRLSAVAIASRGEKDVIWKSFFRLEIWYIVYSMIDEWKATKRFHNTVVIPVEWIFAGNSRIDEFELETEVFGE